MVFLQNSGSYSSGCGCGCGCGNDNLFSTLLPFAIVAFLIMQMGGMGRKKRSLSEEYTHAISTRGRKIDKNLNYVVHDIF